MGVFHIFGNKYGCFLGIMLLFANHLLGQELPSSCSIKLQMSVVDVQGNPLAYVSVGISGQNIGGSTNEEGILHFRNLCKDNYSLAFSRIGWETFLFTLSIEKDTSIRIILRESGIMLDKITVLGEGDKLGKNTIKEVLDQEALRNTMGFGLAESLKQLPGVQTLNTGASISKPIIQGLHSNRVVILQNGVRQEGQQWGSEHAPEIDPFLSTKIQVIKGAGSIRYGGDALGGIILVEPSSLKREKGVDGEVHLQGMSNGKLGILSGQGNANLSVGNVPLSGRIQGTLKNGGNLHTPDYFMNNTGVREKNFSWMLGTEKNKLQSTFFYSRFFSILGILKDAHIGNLTDLMTAIERGRPLSDGIFSREIGRPQQQILHEFFQWKNIIELQKDGQLEINLSRQFNRRKEFDAHRNFGSLPASLENPNILFEITTHRAEIDFEHNWSTNFHGHLGLALMKQVNTTDRGGLIPDYSQWTGGTYYTLKYKKPASRWELEGGIRYDMNRLSIDDENPKFQNFKKKDFQGFSGTLSSVFQFSKTGFMVLQTGSSWRTPHVSELFSEGVHHGSASYEKGNPFLVPERALNNSIHFEWKNAKWKLQATAYYNWIDKYIFLSPQREAILTIRGAFPAFLYSQTNVRIAGIDGNMTYSLNNHFDFTFQADVVKGRNISGNDFLIYMPTNKVQLFLTYFLNVKEIDTHSFVRTHLIYVAKQQRVPADFDYALPPDAYLRLDIEFLTHINHKFFQNVELGIALHNATNTRYREYLNRFRYFIQEPGRNLVVRLSIPLGKS
jgi:iron complex outermembrane receptor protein